MITDSAPVEAVPAERRRRGRLAGYAAATVVALAPLAYAADLALAGTTVPAGVVVGSDGTVAAGVPRVEIGGLGREDAERAVAEAYAAVTGAPVRVAIEGEESALDPAATGLALDPAATVADALDPGLLPWRRVQARFGTLTVEPVTRTDDARLAETLAELEAQVEPAVVHAGIVYDGLEPVARDPSDGRGIDEAAARDALEAEWLAGGVVALPVVDVAARGTTAQVTAALDAQGRAAVAAPVTVAVDGWPAEEAPEAAAPAADEVPEPAGTAGAAQVLLAPEALAPNLVLEVGQDGALAPRVDGEGLRASAAEELAAVEQPPVDATFATDGEAVSVVPSSTGLAVPAADLAAAVESVALEPAPRSARVTLAVTEPELTTAEAEALGVVERVSTFTSEHPCCQPRVRNIHRIADLLDGHLVLPGETFSLNDTVGQRTRANGFVAAPQISEGRFTDGVGGGISQFTTALFNAVFFAGLEDVQHTPHSYYISRYPPGRESTVSFPEPDFRFRNDSDAAILIDTSYTERAITVSFYGAKRYDVEAVEGPRRNTTSSRTIYDPSSDCEPMSGGRGFDITVTRVFSQGGEEVRREQFETRYKAQPRVICSPPPSATPTPSPSAGASPSPSPSPAAADPGDTAPADTESEG